MNTNLSVDEQANKKLTFIIYICYIISWFTVVTAIIAITINYIKRDQMQGTFLASHFSWQINTFWFGILCGIIGILTLRFIIGWLILLVSSIWITYRIVKGMLNLNDNKPMYT